MKLIGEASGWVWQNMKLGERYLNLLMSSGHWVSPGTESICLQSGGWYFIHSLSSQWPFTQIPRWQRLYPCFPLPSRPVALFFFFFTIRFSALHFNPERTLLPWGVLSVRQRHVSQEPTVESTVPFLFSSSCCCGFVASDEHEICGVLN